MAGSVPGRRASETSQVLGYLFITLALPRLPAAVGAVLLFVQPVATLVLAAVLLGERPSPIQLTGVALVLGGVAFAAAPFRRRPAAAEGPGRPPLRPGRRPAGDLPETVAGSRDNGPAPR